MLQKTFRPELFRFQVYLLASMSEIDTTHHECVRFKRSTGYLNSSFRDARKGQHAHGVDPQRFGTNRIQIRKPKNSVGIVTALDRTELGDQLLTYGRVFVNPV